MHICIHRRPVVPWVSAHGPHAEGEEEEEGGEEARRVARVDERHGRLEDPFAGAGQIDQRSNGLQTCNGGLC